MASNKELIVRVEELAANLGVEAETEGLTNRQLVSLVAELSTEESTSLIKKMKNEDGVAGGGDRTPGVYVAEGKAITSKVGMLTEGMEIGADKLAGGQGALDDLIKGSHCVRVG